MKYILLLVSILFSIHSIAEEMTLSEAIKTKKVECTITGNSESTHYLRPITLKIKSLKGNTKIRIDNGLIFEAADSSYQDIVITQQLTACLEPGETKTFHLSGMCIEEHNSAPATKIAYRPRENKDEKLKKMALFIEQKKYFNQTAQQAVWVIRGSRKIEDVSGYANDGYDEIIAYTASLLNVPIPPKPDVNDYKRNYYTQPSQLIIKGHFEMDFPVESNVTIGMFNDQGLIVRELYNNPHHPSGQVKIPFSFDASLYTDPYYYMKMIVDGEVFIERKISTQTE